MDMPCGGLLSPSILVHLKPCVFFVFHCVIEKFCIFAGGVYARLVKQSSVKAVPGGGDKGVQYFDTVNTVSHKLTASYLSPIVPNALSCLLKGTKS